MTLTDYLSSQGKQETPSAVGELLSKQAEQELVAYCNKAFLICKQNRLQFERIWYMNMAFYFGKQYAEWTNSVLDSGALQTEQSFSRLHTPPAPKWRVRLVCNKVRPFIRKEIAKVTKEKPRGFVIPASTEENDRLGAKAAESIYEAIWRDLHMNRVIRRSALWLALCGSAFIKDWYEKDETDLYGVKGAIKSEPVSPFHFYVPDLQEEELESQPYVIHAMAKDPDWVYKNFNVKVIPDSGAGTGVLEQRFLSALGIGQINSDKRYVAVKEAWYKSNRRFKDGACIIWAGDKILYFKEGWPYDHKEYNFTKIDHIPTGRFYGDSTICDLIPLQKEYNRGRSQVLESRNKMSRPQLAAYRGSIEVNKVTSEPGLVVLVKPGYAMPEPIPLQNLPGYVMDSIDRAERDMQDAASAHEISKGTVPTGVTAATAISFLQEQDDSSLHMTVSSVEEGVERISRHFLSNANQFWSAQRKIRVIGEGGRFESYMFSKANIRGNIDFKIEAGSATPTSRAAKQAFIMELMKNGYIPPDRGLRYLDMAETGRLYEEMQLNPRQAQRENLKMLAGEEILTNNYDDDLVHLFEHENCRKTEEYENSDPECKQRFEAHCTLHKQHLAGMQGLMLAPGDPKLDALARGLPVGMPTMGAENGQQPQQPPASPQGGVQ